MARLWLSKFFGSLTCWNLSSAAFQLRHPKEKRLAKEIKIRYPVSGTLFWWFLCFSDLRSSLSLGEQLHRASELPLLFHVFDLLVNPHDLHFHPLSHPRPLQPRPLDWRSRIGLAHSHGHYLPTFHSDFRPHWISHCLGQPRSDHEWTSNREISRRL